MVSVKEHAFIEEMCFLRFTTLKKTIKLTLQRTDYK